MLGPLGPLGPLGSFVEFDQSGQTTSVGGFPMMQGRAVSRTAHPSPLWMIAAAISAFPPSISAKTRRTAAFIPTSSFQPGRTARQSCSVTGAWVWSRGQPQERTSNRFTGCHRLSLSFALLRDYFSLVKSSSRGSGQCRGRPQAFFGADSLEERGW